MNERIHAFMQDLIWFWWKNCRLHLNITFLSSRWETICGASVWGSAGSQGSSSGLYTTSGLQSRRQFLWGCGDTRQWCLQNFFPCTTCRPAQHFPSLSGDFCLLFIFSVFQNVTCLINIQHVHTGRHGGHGRSCWHASAPHGACKRCHGIMLPVSKLPGVL